jgi:hypothetical protein
MTKGCDQYGNTLLHTIAINAIPIFASHVLGLVEALIYDFDMDHNARNDMGQTPLDILINKEKHEKMDFGLSLMIGYLKSLDKENKSHTPSHHKNHAQALESKNSAIGHLRD